MRAAGAVTTTNSSIAARGSPGFRPRANRRPRAPCSPASPGKITEDRFAVIAPDTTAPRARQFTLPGVAKWDRLPASKTPVAATRPIPIPEDAHSFPFEDSLVVARPPIPGLFLLNPTARVVWEYLRDGLDLEQAAGELSAAAGVALEVVRHDIHASVAEWEQQGLLGPVPPPQEIGRAHV